MSVDQQAETRPELTDRERAAQIQQLMDAEPLPMIQRSVDAFRNDLPKLLNTHRGQWAAYHGDERLGFGKSQTDLYLLGFRRGLTRNDFIVAFIEPGAFDPEEEIDVAFPDV